MSSTETVLVQTGKEVEDMAIESWTSSGDFRTCIKDGLAHGHGQVWGVTLRMWGGLGGG